MSNSRENSPDWLHSFQAPTHSILTLSSGSESPLDDGPLSEDEERFNSKKPSQTSLLPENGQEWDSGFSPTRKSSKAISPNNVSSSETTSLKRKRKNIIDLEFGPDDSPKKEVPVIVEELSSHETTEYPVKKDRDAVPSISGNNSLNPALKTKSSRKRLKTDYQLPVKKDKSNRLLNKKENDLDTDGDMGLVEDENGGKQTEPHVSSSRVPLILPDNVQRSKALVECEGGSIDLSGDVGAVGRIVISENLSKNHEMFLDLKGTMYKTTIVPSRTFCVVSFGQSEAKIEAIMNDFIQLTPQSNVYEAETMVEGTLEGFSFESEDEADKLPKANNNEAAQNEGAKDPPKGKARGKVKAQKASGMAAKKGKAAGGKPTKKPKKKTQAPKKSKTKK